MFIAARTGSVGSVDINGCELSLTDIVHVGYGGSGSLTLAGSGTITSDKADIGGFSSSSIYAFNFVDQGMVLNATYDLITFATTSITNVSEFEFLNVGGFDGDFAYSSDGKTLQFNVTTVPEPSTWALLLVAALLAGLRIRRSARARKSCKK